MLSITRRTGAIVAVATGMVLGFATTAPATVGATSATAVPAAQHAGTEPQLLDLLAGSSNYLVYLESGLLPAGGHVDTAPVSVPRTHLYARDGAGHVTNLGHAPVGLTPVMSISGGLLTGVTEKINCCGQGHAYWWKLGSHRHGRFKRPAGTKYLTAAPDGAVLARGNKLLEVTTDGHVRHWGVPIAGATYLTAVSDGRGVAIIGAPDQAANTPTRVAYMRFSRPGHFKRLGYSTRHTLYCADVNSIAVGCHSEDQQGGIVETALIPLGGSAATTTDTGALTLGLIGGTAIWADLRGQGLESISLGHPRVHHGPAKLTPVRYGRTIAGTDAYPLIRQFGPLLVSGLGKVAIVQAKARRVTLVSSVEHGRHLFSVPRSRAAVSAFGLTSGRAVYAGDIKVDGDSNPFASYTVAIKQADHRATFGRPHLLHAGSDYVLAGTSKQLKVYAVHSGQERSDLKVVYAGVTHTIAHVAFDTYLQVSGARVMYAANRYIGGGPTAVYDAATGTTTTVETNAACCDEFEGTYGGTTPALSGSHVFYMKSDGSVWQHDLADGAETQLAAPRDGTLGGVVFAAGHRVAWTVLTGKQGRPDSHSFVRSFSPLGPAQHVSQRVVGMSTAGVLTTDSHLDYRPGHVGFRGSYTLQHFNGTQSKALSPRWVFVLPKIAGRTLGWVDTAGRLHVKAL